MRRIITVGVLIVIIAAGGGWFVVKKVRPTAKSVANSVSVSCESQRPTILLKLGNTYVDEQGFYERKGEKMISFVWELTPQLSQEKPDYCPETFISGRILYSHATWYLVRSRQPSPEHDSKNYWYRSVYKYANNSILLKDLQPGIHHFRVCLWLDNRCLLYSNNLTLDVSADGTREIK